MMSLIFPEGGFSNFRMGRNPTLLSIRERLKILRKRILKGRGAAMARAKI